MPKSKDGQDDQKERYKDESDVVLDLEEFYLHTHLDLTG